MAHVHCVKMRVNQSTTFSSPTGIVKIVLMLFYLGLALIQNLRAQQSRFKKIENVCSQGKSVWITLSCLVYQIWKTRNKAIWQAKFKSTQSIKKTIKMELKAHSYIIYIKENDRDTSWLYRTIYDVQFCCFMCYYYGILSYLMFSSYLLCT